MRVLLIFLSSALTVYSLSCYECVYLKKEKSVEGGNCRNPNPEYTTIKKNCSFCLTVEDEKKRKFDYLITSVFKIEF
jgi:hypothetical protein